jgi:ElaB/YqjD/DUF883 family membrane-anchored ribosome-binding protein
MATDRVGDAFQTVVGTVQDALSGDTRAQFEKKARYAAAQAKDAYGEVLSHTQDATAGVGRGVEQQPLIALLIAGAIGYVAGKLLHRC